MTSGQIAVAGILVTLLLGIIGVVLQLSAAQRQQREHERKVEELRQAALVAARGAGYDEGAADKARELAPQIALLRDQRDGARRERDQCEQQRDAALRRVEVLEDRLMRGGGNGK